MRQSAAKFKGTGVALVTPFKQKAVDYAALEHIIEHVIAGGVDYIVSLGTTGEAITLSGKECREVFDFTIKVVNGRKPIVAGLFGGNFTEALVEKIKNYDLEGFDAIMSSSPAYNKPSQEGIFQHYMLMESVSPVPIIIYNVPSRTGSNIKAETIVRLAQASEKFVAVKEASGDLNQVMKILKDRPADFLVLSGEDPLTIPMMSCGAEGAISVIANMYPLHFSSMINAALEGDFHTAAKFNAELLDVHPWLYCEGNPVGVKGAMEILGHCSREVRIPLTPLSEGAYQGLKREMDKVRALDEVLV
jgi:4-hydroxy-tetrahydrodipicolinate synthase